MIKIPELLSKKNFNKFVEDNQLVLPKSKIAKHFCITRPTLLKWMKKKGYGHLVGEFRGKQKNKEEKEIPKEEIVEDFMDVD